eukprot:6193800-Pleurochrysis_carterae.AAC.2
MSWRTRCQAAIGGASKTFARSRLQARPEQFNVPACCEAVLEAAGTPVYTPVTPTSFCPTGSGAVDITQSASPRSPLPRQRLITSIEAFRTAEHSCNTLGDGLLADGAHRVCPKLCGKDERDKCRATTPINLATLGAVCTAALQATTSAFSTCALAGSHARTATAATVRTRTDATHPSALDSRRERPHPLGAVPPARQHLNAGTRRRANNRGEAPNEGVPALTPATLNSMQALLLETTYLQEMGRCAGLQSLRTGLAFKADYLKVRYGWIKGMQPVGKMVSMLD